jgi:hypothetical protein
MDESTLKNKMDEKMETKTELEKIPVIKVRSSFGPDKVMTKEQYNCYKSELNESFKKYNESEENELKNPRKRTRELLYRSYNQEIKNIIFNNSKTLKYFNEIIITREVYKKANIISQRTVELTGDNEIYLFLLNKLNHKKIDNVLRDVYILKGQKVCGVECGRPTIRGEIESFDDIKKQGYYLAGWAHSHARMETFHSTSTDEPNLDKMSSYGSKLRIIPKPFSCSDTKFIVKYFPSIVFNALNSKPNCAIGITYPTLKMGQSSLRTFYMNKKPKLKVIDEDNQIELSTSVLDNQIIERLEYSGKQRRLKKQKLTIESQHTSNSNNNLSKPLEEMFSNKDLILNEIKNIGRRKFAKPESFYPLLKEIQEDYFVLKEYCNNLEDRIKSLEDRLESKLNN